MNRFSGAEFIAHATLMRLNAERGAQLEELGKQTNALVKEIEGDLVIENTDVTGDDNVPIAGS